MCIHIFVIYTEASYFRNRLIICFVFPRFVFVFVIFPLKSFSIDFKILASLLFFFSYVCCLIINHANLCYIVILAFLDLSDGGWLMMFLDCQQLVTRFVGD